MRRLSGKVSAYAKEARRLRKASTAKRDVTLTPELEAILKNSGGSNQFLDWLTRSMPADEDLRRNARRLRARARDLQDTTPYVQHGLEMIADGIVGASGPRMAAELKGKDGALLDPINTDLEQKWQAYARRPVTLDGKLDLVSFARLILTTTFRDGEAFVRFWRGRKYNPYGLAFEAIDPDMIDEQYNIPSSEGQNEVRLGVEVDKFGRPVAYHLVPERGPYGALRGERERIPATDMIHVFRPRRVNQTRGVTALLPVLVSLKMEQSYSDAELMAAVIGAAKCFVYEQQQRTDGLAPEVRDEDKDGEFNTQVEPGLGWKLPLGWTVKMLETGHPPTAYPSFTKAIVRKIAIGFGLSYHSASGDLEATSYSSGRIGMLQERDFFRNVQRFFFAQFFDPVCTEWLDLADLAGKITVPSYNTADYLDDIRWIGRGWSYVDPEKEGQANALDLQNGLTSHSRIHAELGLDYEDTLGERKRDRDLRKKYGEPEPVITTAAPKPKPASAEEDATPPAEDAPAKHLNGNGNGNGHNRLASVLTQ